MKRHFIISLAFLLATAILQAAPAIKTQGKVSSVTVFPGSARVTRQASIELPQGNSSILVSGLPLNLQESSLRVSGKGDQPVVLGSVALRRDIHQEAVLEQEKTLRLQLEEQQLLLQQTTDGKQQQLRQMEFIHAMGTGGKGDKPSSYLQLPPDQWQQAWQLMQQATAEAQLQIREADTRTRQINKRIQQLQAQLKQIATNQRSTRSALLSVSATHATRLKLQLTYQVNGARWVPVYDAYLDSQSGQLQLRSLAQISQNTGEDWQDVALTLSTLRPGAGAGLPTLNPWVIDFYTPPAATAKHKNDYRARRDMAMAAPAAELAMSEEAAPLVTTDYSAEYPLATPVSLSSGSDKRRFTLASQDYPTELQLASAPRLDPRVMLTSKLSYTAPAPLLAGSINLYRDGNYVGRSRLAETQSGEEIQLAFGEDDKVKINFHPDPDRKSKSGLLFGKRKEVERNYLVNLLNNHKVARNITLYDALPVAADAQISVQPTGDKPTEVNVDEKKGIVSWVRSLPAGKEVKLRYGYNVTYPEDQQLQGL